MTRRIFLLLWLTLQAVLAAPPADPTPTNLVEVLRGAIAPPNPDTPKGGTNAHRLAAGDVVQLLVYQEEDLNLPRSPIATDGTISHPLLGLIPIGGKTLEQAKQTILDMLRKDYLVDPRVGLTILEYAKSKFTLLGQVNRPGSYEFPSNESLTLAQAVALAGGPTRLGSSKVKIQRSGDDTKKEIKLDLDRKEDKAALIQDGDVIEVAERWL
jgi:polysaccharide biosynthesis/export protein VpsN